MAERDPVFGLLPSALGDPEAAQALFAPLAREAVEVAAYAFLGEGQQLLGLRHSRSQSSEMLSLPIREIVAEAIRLDAHGVVIAHNHPGGDPEPSAADRDATRLLARALDPLGIRLLDHLVIAESGFVSFRKLGLL
jgi:DNA repair protein RadC